MLEDTMLVLDFSKETFCFSDYENKATTAFHRSILDFLKDWYSDSDYILVKTSGSTGTPKEIKLPKLGMRQSANMTMNFLNINKGGTAILCLPVDYIAGKLMIVRAIEFSLKLICIQPSSIITLDKSAFESIDLVAMTPMQLEKSIPLLENVKKLIIGGAPLSEPLKAKLFHLDCEMYESYGMTETITHIALKRIPTETHNKPRNFELLEGIQINLDHRGCLEIQTPYFQEKITTNDLVEIHNDYSFTWLARVDNVINSGGIKLFPEQIEAKLKPFLSSEFIIAALSDDLLGQKLILLIEGEERELNLDFKEMGLSKYEIPKKVQFIDRFPRTKSGKIQRNKLMLKVVQKDI